MRRVAGALRIVAAAFLVALGVAAIIGVADRDSWPAAQLDTVAVLSTTERTPVLAWAVRLVTERPRVEETRVGRQPSVLFRPGGRGPWPAIVFVNGATRLGRHHPKVQRLARGLARAGFLVVVPDLPGLREGEITPATTEAAARGVEATADLPKALAGHVSLYGVSVGASLALLVAERPALAPRVTIVAGEAPWTDMKKVIRLATTGRYGGEPYATD